MAASVLVAANLVGCRSVTNDKATVRLVSFPTQDGGLIYADLYGHGERAVLLAHGGRFNKESWTKQARALANQGYRVLAIDFRGYGQSRGPGQSEPMSAPLHFDVLGGIRYLRETGAKTVSLIGGSLGGSAAADASILAEPNEVDRLILLGANPRRSPEKLKVPKLFIVTRDDVESGNVPRLPATRATYDQCPEPKELLILDGSAHAQFMFDTELSERVMREILRFLPTP